MKRKYSKMKIASAILGAACIVTFAFAIISEASTTTEIIRYEKEADYGDTVWSICAKIATDEDDLNKLVWQTMKDNYIENAADLQPGQKIIVNVQRARKS